MPRPAEEPRRADDPARPDLPLALELRRAVDRERVRHVGLDVRLALRPVEDVVGRVVDDGRAELDDAPRAERRSRSRSPGRILLRDDRPSSRRRVEDEIRGRSAPAGLEVTSSSAARRRDAPTGTPPRARSRAARRRP